jgi:hypothetical protein
MLPRLIEYLLSVRMPGAGGRPLCTQGATQAIIPIFPANTRVVSQVTPPSGLYMDIIYKLTMDPDVVPGALEAYASHVGGQTLNGVMTSWFLENDVNAFEVVTQNSPAGTVLENITALPQYYAANIFYISVGSKLDADILFKYLDALVADKLSSPDLWTSSTRLMAKMKEVMGRG